MHPHIPSSDPATASAPAQALLLTLTDTTDLPAGPDLPRRVANALGGTARAGVDVDLGVQFWVTGSPGPLNRYATGMLSALVADIAAGRVGIDAGQRRRLAVLLAHGWEADLHGTCVVTGSLDTDGMPTTLPGWFLAWMDSRPRRDLEPQRTLLKSLGLPLSNVNGLLVSTARPALRHGYETGVPDEVEDAWGCRGLIHRTPGGAVSRVEIPGDRVSMVGPDADDLVAALDEAVGDTLAQRVARLLRVGALGCGVAAEVIVFQDERIVIKADTQGSHEHVDVCAYFHGATQL